MGVVILNGIKGSDVYRIVRLPSCEIGYDTRTEILLHDLITLCPTNAMPVIDKEGKAWRGTLCLYVVGYLVNYDKYVVCDCLTDKPFIYDKAEVLDLCKHYKVYGIRIEGTEVHLIDARQELFNPVSTFDRDKFDKLVQSLRQKKAVLGLTDVQLQPYILTAFEGVYGKDTPDYLNAVFEYNKLCLGLPGWFFIDSLKFRSDLASIYVHSGNSLYTVFKEGSKLTKIMFVPQTAGVLDKTAIAICSTKDMLDRSKGALFLLECCLDKYASFNYSHSNTSALTKIYVVDEDATQNLDYRSTLWNIPTTIPKLPKATTYRSWSAPKYGIAAETVVFDDNVETIFEVSAGYSGTKALYIGKKVNVLRDLNMLDSMPMLRYIVFRGLYMYSVEIVKKAIKQGILIFCVRNSQFAEYIQSLVKMGNLHIIEHGEEAVAAVNAFLDRAEEDIPLLRYSPKEEEKGISTYSNFAKGTLEDLSDGTLHICYIATETSDYEMADVQYNKQMEELCLNLLNAFRASKSLDDPYCKQTLDYVVLDDNTTADILYATLVKDFKVRNEQQLRADLKTKELLCFFMVLFKLPAIVYKTAETMCLYGELLWLGVFEGFKRLKGHINGVIYSGMYAYLLAIMLCYALKRVQDIEQSIVNEIDKGNLKQIAERRDAWSTKVNSFLDGCPEIAAFFRRYPFKVLEAKANRMLQRGLSLLRSQAQNVINLGIVSVCIDTQTSLFWRMQGASGRDNLVVNTVETDELQNYKTGTPTAEQIAKGLCALNLYLNTTEEENELEETEKYFGLKKGSLDKKQSLIGAMGNQRYLSVFNSKYPKHLFKSCGDFVWLYRYLNIEQTLKSICLKMIGYANPKLYKHIVLFEFEKDTMPVIPNKYKTADFWVYYNTGGLLYNTKPVIQYRFCKKSYKTLQGVESIQDLSYFPVLQSICASDNKSATAFIGIEQK